MSRPAAPEVHIFPDKHGLVSAAASRWVTLARASIAARGIFHVALSGGHTPTALYERLTDPGFRVDWARVQVYWSDERSVPLDQAQSNYRLAREALLERVPIPPAQVHPMITRPEAPAAEAQRYAERLRTLLPADASGLPVFDLVLLGLGNDGHIASLFPDTPILDEHREPVAAVYVQRLGAWRVSLTFPVLEAARHVLMLVSGRDKAEIVRRVLHGPPCEPPLPAQRLRGGIEWYLDREAAGQLPAAGQTDRITQETQP